MTKTCKPFSNVCVTEDDSAVIDHTGSYHFELYFKYKCEENEPKSVLIEISNDGQDYYKYDEFVTCHAMNDGNRLTYRGKTSANHIKIICKSCFNDLSVMYCSN